MVLFIDEHTVAPYDGEVLKRYIGNRLVKAISNPTKKQLAEFGYKELVEPETEPEYDPETQWVEVIYTDGKKVTKEYIVNDIENETQED